MLHDGDDATDTEGAWDPDQDILPDELVDKHFGGGEQPPRPASKAGGSDDFDDDDDTLDDEDLDDDEDQDEDEDEDGDDELDDESDDDDLDEEDEDDEDDEDDDDDDEEEDVLESVTPAERRAIEKNPALRKLHKSMQRDYTRKTTRVATQERELEQRAAGLDQFEKALQTPKGMETFLATNLKNHPEIVGRAFEAVATGDKAHDFLLEVGLHSPEVFEKAYEKFQRLQDDEEALARHVEQRNTKSESAKVQREKQKLARQTFDRESGALVGEAMKVSRKLGIDKEDFEDVRNAVAAVIRENVQEDGKIALTPAEIRRVVKRTKKQIDERTEKARRRLERKNAAERVKRVKSKLKGGKRVVPRGTGGRSSKAPSKRAAAKNAARAMKSGRDPLDAYVDQRLKL